MVQLYLSDCCAAIVRPCMELQGFARVELQPGQRKAVGFLVRADQTAFLDRNRRWKVEAGEVWFWRGLYTPKSLEKGCHIADFLIIDATAPFCYISGSRRASWKYISEIHFENIPGRRIPGMC